MILLFFGLFNGSLSCAEYVASKDGTLINYKLLRSYALHCPQFEVY
jgi:hypothetical protein